MRQLLALQRPLDDTHDAHVQADSMTLPTDVSGIVVTIAVRVELDLKPGDPPMRAGRSANIDIDTSHVRTLSDLF